MSKKSTPISGITRVKKDARFFAASNEPFNDANLSFGARGIMGYLLSKPDGWEVRNQDLYSQSTAGRTAIDRMLKELKVNGYLHREQVHDEKGHLHWVTTVYETKSLNPHYNAGDKNEAANSTERTKPDSRKIRQSENPTVGKPDDIVSTKFLSSTNNKEKEEEAISEKLSSFIANYEFWIDGTLAKIYKPNALVMAGVFVNAGIKTPEAVEEKLAAHAAALQPGDSAGLIVARVCNLGLIDPPDEPNPPDDTRSGKTWYTAEELNEAILH